MLPNTRIASALCLTAACFVAAPPAFAQSASEESSVAKIVITNKAVFEAALDSLAPGTRRNINWDGIPISGQQTIAIAPDFFLASRQIILDPTVPPAELLVSNNGF